MGARRPRKRKRRLGFARAKTRDRVDTIPTMAQAVKTAEADVARRRTLAEAARGMLGRDPDRSFTDELIAERRAEALAEDREDVVRARRGRG